ncbi:Ca-activated chloride channel homolog [Mariprofundus micogutta]|uniref:Ca-activated chloride channel homolog n=2 Tax=Mariprofundus micogutta TaxID=1921010 RepID=A0A1L8CMI0_9PROT|nr:Ca-activated chloride channel homolog [Mariprofundus micogutta]
MELLADFHFLRPWWLLLIPLWLWLAAYVWRTCSSNNGWAALCDPVMLKYLVGETVSQQRPKAVLIALMTGGVLACTALAGPVFQQLPQPLFQSQSAMVIGLDLSRSMLAEDLKPNRLARAKQKLQDILALRREGQTGLIVFAGSAFDVVPLTTDNRAILAMLDSLHPSMMPAQGSKASAALEHAYAMFKRGAISNGHVLLLTDGVDAAASASAERLQQAGHRVSVFGVGTEDGAPIPVSGSNEQGGFLKDGAGNIIIPRLNQAELSLLADTGGGIYRAIRFDDSDINSLPDLIPSQAAESRKESMQTDRWREEGPWLLLVLLLPLLSLAFRRGLLLLLLVLPFGFSDSAYAMAWQDWWQTRDQQGQALIQQDADDAASRFENPDWKAAAQYRAGKYKESADTLTSTEHADGWYNRGNALAKAGDLKGAAKAYEQALAKDAAHEDAQFNLELVKKAQQKSEQQQSDQNQSGDGQPSDEQGDQQQSNEKQEQSSSQSDSGDRQDKSGNQSEQDAQPEQSAADNNEQQENNQQDDKPQPEQNQAGDEQKEQSSQQSQAESGDKEEEQSEQAAQTEQADEQQSEEMKASQQWLRRIPDDPGGLLKRKFQYQYRQQGEQSGNKGTQTW